MKRKILLFFVIAALFCSCDTRYTMWKVSQGIHVFRVKDPSYLEYALVDSVLDTITGQYKLQVMPAVRHKENPFFIPMNAKKEDFPKVTLCDIANEKSVYYPLECDFYMCYPFTTLIRGRYVSSCKWKDLCNADMDTVRVICRSSDVFENIHFIGGDWASNHYNKRLERLTLQEMVDYVNRWICINNSDLWVSPSGGMLIESEDGKFWQYNY